MLTEILPVGVALIDTCRRTGGHGRLSRLFERSEKHHVGTLAAWWWWRINTLIYKFGLFCHFPISCTAIDLGLLTSAVSQLAKQLHLCFAPACSCLSFQHHEHVYRVRVYRVRWIELKKGLCIVKVKCTLVQALRLCTGRTAHRGSKRVALLFHDQR